MESILNLIRGFFAQTYAIVCAVIAWTWAIQAFIGWLIVKLIGVSGNAINAIATHEGFATLRPSDSLLNILAIANTFFPLQLVLGFLVSYATLIIFLTIYRWVKSYIPLGFGFS